MKIKGRKDGRSQQAKLVQLSLLAILTVVWVLPILLVAIVGELPYLHEYLFTERFIFITVVMALVLAAACAYDSKGFAKNWKAGNAGKTKWEIGKDNALGLAGLIMFNAGAAAWGGNVLGLGVRILPGHYYQSVVEVTEVKYQGVKLRAAHMTVKDKSNGHISYLSLAKRHFDYSGIREGSLLALGGKQGALGTYINNVEIVHETQQLSPNFPMNSDAAFLQRPLSQR